MIFKLNDYIVKQKQHANHRFIFLFLLFLSINFTAVAFSQDINTTKISVNFSSKKLIDLIPELEKITNLRFEYQHSLFKNNNPIVTLKAEQQPIAIVLNRLFLNTMLTYKQVGNSILIIAKPVPAKKQKPGRISGKILDDKGETLPGASISVVETGVGTQTGVDGSYILNLQPGAYILEISYVSFQTQRITGVIVSEDKNTPLNVALKPETNSLSAVVITSGYRKASTDGLLVRQKNASEISNGISAEQISRTPDKNIGESLKRVSGISTVDNKFVVVRGIGERYNSATLDGTLLPSTEAQNRSFSFDMIPSNLVDNVVVSKTVTPDMNASFGGGLIQINTKDIPNENFMSFTAGASYNDQSTGKDFLSHKRGKYDHFGFDDGRRDFPKNLVVVQGEKDENKITEQSKRFTNDNFTVYKYKTAPSQNYQFSIGRLLALDTSNSNKFGFTGSLSYRNTQSINNIEQTIRGSWLDETNNTGNGYSFNTTMGGLLNMGLQLGNHRFSLRNTYTHLYDNTLVRTVGYENDNGAEFAQIGIPNRIQEADNPAFTGLLQNKLAGQHQLDKIKLEWDFARTDINRKEKDLGIATKMAAKLGADYEYFYDFGNTTEPRNEPTSRQNYHNSESNYSWNVAATLPFDLGKVRNSVKAGYFGIQKKADFHWEIVPFVATFATLDESLKYLPIGEMIKPENMGPNGFTFRPWYTDFYEGKSQNHAGYLMLDNRLNAQLRLVWGVRGEYYEYKEINNAFNDKQGAYGESFSIKPDKKWQWMPSANLTYSPVSSLNVRAAYSSSVVRPEMMDNSKFFRYSAYLGGVYGSNGLYSTRIDSWDFKTEWFPGLGEILSAGAFFKKFDKPAELVLSNSASGANVYQLTSSDWAKVYGLEFELRKTLAFIYDTDLLRNLAVYGNFTLQKSDVKSTYMATDPNDPTGGQVQVTMKQARAMYGQTPYLINAGLQYNGERLGLNLVYNKTGLRTAFVANSPEILEYEQPRELLDAQVSYRFMKKRLEVKLNASNLLNTVSVIYNNMGSYERNPDYEFSGDASDAQRLKQGFSDKYEDGDRIVFKQRFGRTFSTSLTYTF